MNDLIFYAYLEDMIRYVPDTFVKNPGGSPLKVELYQYKPWFIYFKTGKRVGTIIYDVNAQSCRLEVNDSFTPSGAFDNFKEKFISTLHSSGMIRVKSIQKSYV